MADVTVEQHQRIPDNLAFLFKDMGDGSHAEQVYIGDGLVVLSAGTNGIGFLVAPTSGGWDYHSTIDLDETPQEIKAGTAVWGGGLFINRSDSPVYLKIYNALAADVTVGVTVPDITLHVPTLGDTNGAGFVPPGDVIGVGGWTNGLTMAVTTGIADDDSGAPGANAVNALVLYK